MQDDASALKELAVLAAAQGLHLTADQLETVWPEVRRLREYARRLTELPLDPEEPATRFASG